MDVCLIATALHDLPEDGRKLLLAEVARILTPQGYRVVIEFKKLDHGPGPRMEMRIDENELAALVVPYGFRKITSVSLGEYTYLASYNFV